MSKKCGGCSLPPVPKFPNKALQLPAEPPVMFHKKQFPASIGDDTTNPPETLNYKNVILEYQANGHVYIYSSDGIPTRIDGFDADDFLEKLAKLGTKIEEEIVTREEADRLINQKLEQHDEELASHDQALDELEGRLNGTVQLDTLVSNDASTVTIGKRLGGLGTLGTLTNMPLPVASSTAAGVMNAALYNAVQLNAENVDALLGGAVALEGLAKEPSQSDLTIAWKQATQRPNLVNRASILDVTNNKVWYYYENISEWFAIPVNPQVTVSIATNDTPGIVKGSEVAGQIAVEADGTMSLNGYDGLTHDIENLTALMPTVKNEYGDSETDAISQKFISDKLNGESVALGQNAKFHPSFQAVTVVGARAQATSAGGTAVGVAASVGTYGTAIGESAKASYNHSVALGNNSQTTRNSEVSIGDPSLYPASPVYSRYLANVKAGELPNDAVNLQQVQDMLADAGGGKLYSEYGDNEDGALTQKFVSEKLNAVSVAIGQNSDAQTDTSVAIGANTRAGSSGTGSSGIAIGYQAQSGNFGGLAIGHTANSASISSVAIGSGTKTNGVYSVALGHYSTANRAGEVSIGNGGNNTEYGTRYLANVKAGELPEDAVNLKQMQDYVSEHGGGEVPERAKHLPLWIPTWTGGATGGYPYFGKVYQVADMVGIAFNSVNLDTGENLDAINALAWFKAATTEKAGVMTAADKTKLDGLGEAMTVEEFNLAWEAA